MMKNRMKKLIGMSLAVVMAGTLLAGCGNSESGKSSETSKESSQESSQESESAASESRPTEDTASEENSGKQRFDGVELKMFVNYAEGTYTEQWLEAVNAILSEELGVTITEIEGYADETYELVLGGDEDIDLVFAANWLRYDKNAQDGMFAELTDEDMQTYAPDIWAYAQESGNGILETTKINGVRYAIGMEAEVGRGVWAYRGDLADKYNIGEINNVDDLERYLYAIAENEPDMIPMDIKGASHYSVAAFFYPEIGWTAPGATSYGGAVNVNFYNDDYQVIFSPETEEYLEIVTRMHEWYEAGIFSKSILSSTTDIAESFAAGRSGVANYWHMSAAQTAFDEFQADDRKDWDVRFFVAYPEAILLKGNNNAMWAVSGYSDDVEASLAVWNEIFSNEELYKLFYYGLEGVHYEEVDGGIVQDTDPALGWIALGGTPRPDFHYPTNYTLPGADELLEVMDTVKRSYPLNSMTVSYDAVNAQKVAVDEVYAQYTRANLLGVFEGTPEEAVAAEIAAYKAAGVDEYIAEIQRQIDEFVANMQ